MVRTPPRGLTPAAALDVPVSAGLLLRAHGPPGARRRQRLVGEDRGHPTGARAGRHRAERLAAVDHRAVGVLVGLPRDRRLLADAGLGPVADAAREGVAQLLPLG